MQTASSHRWPPIERQQDFNVENSLNTSVERRPHLFASDDDTFEPLLNADEASALLGIHPKTIQIWARRGDVPCIRVGEKYIRFRASSLDLWVKNRLDSQPASRDRAKGTS
jgi:excisionase family DNA binding protein